MKSIARNYHLWNRQMRENWAASREGRPPKTLKIGPTPVETTERRANTTFWAAKYKELGIT